MKFEIVIIQMKAILKGTVHVPLLLFIMLYIKVILTFESGRKFESVAHLNES